MFAASPRYGFCGQSLSISSTIATTAALKALTAAAASEPGDQNVMERILDAARAYATEGEIRNAMREVYGDYVESAEF